MGTQLQAKGLKTGECPEILSITHPEIVEDIHRAYINAGSMIIYSNTFGANSYKLAESGYSVKEVVSDDAFSKELVILSLTLLVKLIVPSVFSGL